MLLSDDCVGTWTLSPAMQICWPKQSDCVACVTGYHRKAGVSRQEQRITQISLRFSKQPLHTHAHTHTRAKPQPNSSQ